MAGEPLQPQGNEQQSPDGHRTVAVPAAPFYLASTVATLVAVVLWRLGGAEPGQAPAGLVASVSAILTIAVLLLLCPLLLRVSAGPAESVAQSSELRPVLRELARSRVLIESLGEGVANSQEAVRGLTTKLDALARQVANGHEEVRCVRLEREALRAETRAWADTAIECMSYFERLLDHLPNDHAGRPLIAKAADVLSKLLQARRLERIAPVPGDPFLIELHEIAGEELADGAASGTIVRCLEWGYRWNGDLVRRAKVTIAR